MQFIAILLSIIVFASSMTVIIYAIPIVGKLKNEFSNMISFNKYNHQYVVYGDPYQNSTSLSINNKVKGTLFVKVIVNNKDVGNKLAQDFKVNIHANDPIPSYFDGNSSGTTVKLGMGMYSITESSIPGYISYFSSDCLGGIMSTGNKECIITNIQNASSLLSK